MFQKTKKNPKNLNLFQKSVFSSSKIQKNTKMPKFSNNSKIFQKPENFLKIQKQNYFFFKNPNT